MEQMMTYLKNDSSFDEMMEIIMQHGLPGMRQATEVLLNEVMKMQRTDHLRAEPYERSEFRLDYANGFKPKTIKSRLGELNVAIPQTRNSDFYPSCLERGLRSERALSLALAQMYVEGVSTRKVKKVVEQMCGMEVSSSMVSKASKQLDESLSAWRERPLKACAYLFLDARYESIRVGGVVRDCAVLIALGIDSDGNREVLGVDISLSEAEVHWKGFLESLGKRGLSGVQMIISDAHVGLKAARKAVFPSVLWQRCQFHLQQNASQYVSRRDKKEQVAAEIRAIFNASDLAAANILLKDFVQKHQSKMPDLSMWAEENIPESLSVMRLGLSAFNAKRLRTSNMLERLNQTIKQRTRVAKIFPNTDSCLRLVTAILVETSEQWIHSKSYLSVK
jgi:transposase-like protein